MSIPIKLISSREEIKESEEKYRNIHESIDRGYFEINREGHFDGVIAKPYNYEELKETVQNFIKI